MSGYLPRDHEEKQLSAYEPVDPFSMFARHLGLFVTALDPRILRKGKILLDDGDAFTSFKAVLSESYTKGTEAATTPFRMLSAHTDSMYTLFRDIVEEESDPVEITRRAHTRLFVDIQQDENARATLKALEVACNELDTGESASRDYDREREKMREIKSIMQACLQCTCIITRARVPTQPHIRHDVHIHCMSHRISKTGQRLTRASRGGGMAPRACKLS